MNIELQERFPGNIAFFAFDAVSVVTVFWENNTSNRSTTTRKNTSDSDNKGKWEESMRMLFSAYLFIFFQTTFIAIDGLT